MLRLSRASSTLRGEDKANLSSPNALHLGWRRKTTGSSNLGCEWKGLRARENICNLCVFLSDLRWFFPAIDVEDKDLLHIFHVACWACFWFSCLAPCTSFGFPFSVLIVPQEFLDVQMP